MMGWVARGGVGQVGMGGSSRGFRGGTGWAIQGWMGQCVVWWIKQGGLVLGRVGMLRCVGGWLCGVGVWGGSCRGEVNPGGVG